MKLADARQYQGYRGDVVLDMRQMAVALRKLRAFAREGAADELDLDGTIDATAKNAGELEVIVRPPRRPNTRVVLLMDVGGSMDPYVAPGQPALLGGQTSHALQGAAHLLLPQLRLRPRLRVSPPAGGDLHS